MLVLHRAKLLASNQSVLALGVAPRQVAGTPVPVFTPGMDAGRVCMHKGFARTQSQPSIHSLSRGKGGRGIGIINQKFILKTDFFNNLRPRSKERGQLYVGFICLF